MKTLKKILFIIVSMSLLIACSKSDHFWDNEPLGNTMKSGHGEPVLVTLPFEMHGTGEYILMEPSSECGYDAESNPMYRVIVNFTGTSFHLGKVTATFDFCCDFNGVYGPAEISLVAANGDVLYMSQEGQVIAGRLEDHPDYVTEYWRDPFVILGGTGRFEGATGGGVSDDYNSSEDPYSHHNWKGTITLIKGKH